MRMPVLFLAHGAPILLDDPLWMAELAQLAHALPRPTAVLVISAHWETAAPTLSATEPVPIIHDYYGFPKKYYELQYAAPSAPALAHAVAAALRGAGQAVSQAPTRGLDHGAYIPLMAMYPQADVPVLQLALPSYAPADLVAMGAALASLRDAGVLLVGSGFITHNMAFAFRPGIPAWAREFDAWVAAAVCRRDRAALLEFRTQAPHAAMALPTWEHFAPLLVALGAAEDDTPAFPIEGWWMDSAFSKRSVCWG